MKKDKLTAKTQRAQRKEVLDKKKLTEFSHGFTRIIPGLENAEDIAQIKEEETSL